MIIVIIVSKVWKELQLITNIELNKEIFENYLKE